MGKEINLLPKKNVDVLQQERTILIIRITAIFSVVCVSSVILGTFILGRSNSIEDVTAQQNAIGAKLQLVKPKIQKEIALVNRVNQIQAIIKTRSSIIKKATGIQDLIPPSVSTEQLSLTSTVFALVISSPSLSALTSCMDNFTNALKKKTIFSSVTIDNVGVDTKGGLYKVSIKGAFL